VEKAARKIIGFFCIFQKLPKENNRPIGENSPNLVTLIAKKQFLSLSDIFLFLNFLTQTTKVLMNSRLPTKLSSLEQF
jgi:hypothetical protein